MTARAASALETDLVRVDNGVVARPLGCALVAVLLAAVAAGCGGPGGDKAGGDRGEPAVLTLESQDDPQLTPAPEFAEAAERLSGGSVRIQVVAAGRDEQLDAERGVVEDVRQGKADLGIVGVRVWDTLGVRSFRALLAPFLVDTLELERRVLERPEADRMLQGVERSGVIGIALLPGPLRRPFGLSRELRGPDDYRGATIGIRPGGVARETLRALGATAGGARPGTLTGLDGLEIDPATIAFSDYERHALTSNVVLWPKPFSIVMNRAAFGALSSERRELLRRAGRAARAAELRQVARDEAAAVAELCRMGSSLIAASPQDVAALRTAVEPVYRELERDPVSRRLIAWVGRQRSEPRALRCPITPGAAGVSADRIEGRWETTWTLDALVAAGVPRRDAAAIAGHHTADFRDGRFRFVGDPGSGRSAEGSYVLDGDIVRLTFRTGIALQHGRAYELRWSVYRDSLTFRRAPGSEPLQAFLTAPYRRIR
jgi:TRAP-type C4-dicarboxylate transport system substrate-binding protein